MKKYAKMPLFGMSLTGLLFFSSACLAATITVDINRGGDYTEIQPAIDAAADGDLVLVKLGKYVVAEPVTFRGKAITLKAEDATRETTIRMSETPTQNDRASVVIFENGEPESSVLDGFKISGGRGTSSGEEWWEHGGGGILMINNSSPTLTNCTITDNSAECGGGVCCYDSSFPTLNDCTISENSAVTGGGVCCYSSATMTGCSITGNRAEEEGGGVSIYDSSAILTGCTISGNRVFDEDGYGGGGVYCSSSTPTLTGCTISGNWSYVGGGMACSGSSPILTNCRITDNLTLASGGGIVCWSSSLSLTNCTITSNIADGADGGGGGGVSCGGVSRLDSSSATLANCIVWDNFGGSISVSGQATTRVTYSCVEGDAVWPGVGNTNEDPHFCAWDDAEVTVGSQEEFVAALTEYSVALAEGSPCLGTGQNGADMGADGGTCASAGEPGRVVQLRRGTYSIEGLSLIHRVSLFGADQAKTVIEGTVRGLRTAATLSQLTVTKGIFGGIRIRSDESPQIVHCTIKQNSSEDYGYGSGVYCHSGSSPFLADCTITENRAVGYGGGVYCHDNSSPNLTNCMITGNWAYTEEWGRGGGVYCDENSSPTLTNCTISGNFAGWWAGGEGGVSSSPESSPILTNCIVWGNVGGSVVGTAQVTYSCIEGEEVWPGEGNMSLDPLFVAPGHWSDAVWTPGDYHLETSSPCIDVGRTDGSPATDIAGNGRPCGSGVDMGAYEMGDCPPTAAFQRGNANADDNTDLSDAVFVLNYLFLGGTAPSCEDAADTNDTGDLDLTDAVYLLNFLFLGGSEPPAPFPTCGSDPTPDELTCESYEGCDEP